MQGTQICKDVSPQRLARQHFSSLIDLACNSLLVYLPCHSRKSLTVSSIHLSRLVFMTQSQMLQKFR